MDSKGGFFYERWGDAPVHSLAVAMMLKTSEVHFFNDIGYKHNPLMHCPDQPWANKKCSCDEKQNFGKLLPRDINGHVSLTKAHIDWTDWSCLTRYSKIQPDFMWDEALHANMTAPYRI